MPNGLAAPHAKGLINGRLKGDVLATPTLLVGGDDEARARIHHPLLETLGREATKDNGMDQAESSTGLHGHHTLD